MEEQVKILCARLGYFPSRREVLGLGPTGLSSYIEKTTNYRTLSKKLGVSVAANRNRAYWNEQKIIDEILKFNAKEIPTSNFLKSIKRADLSSAISKHGGWEYFSEKTGLPMKKSDTLTGWNGEDEIEKILNNLGYKTTRAKTKDHYDILLDDCLRIDVKTAKYAEYGYSTGWFYRMGKTITADIAILYQSDTKNYYIVPWFIATSSNVTITKTGGTYQKYFMNNDLLDKMVKVRKIEKLTCE